VYLLDLRGGRISPLDLPRSIVSTLRFPDKRSDLLFVGAQTARSPNDVWAYSLKDRKLTRWTRSEAGPWMRRRSWSPISSSTARRTAF